MPPITTPMLVRHHRREDLPPAPTPSDLNWNLSDSATALPLFSTGRAPRKVRAIATLDHLMTKGASRRQRANIILRKG